LPRFNERGFLVLFAKEPKAFFWRKRNKTLGLASLRRGINNTNDGRCGTTPEGDRFIFIYLNI
jgi:hypothetical protein